MCIDPVRKSNESGFTLIELMVSMIVFAFAMSALVELANQTSRFTGDAQAQVLGSQLGQNILDRLSAEAFYGAADPDNSPLLQDATVNNTGCWTIIGGCPSDHGQLQAELDILVEPSASGVQSSMLVTDIDGNFGIWYEGFRYLVYWNIEDNVPFNNSILIELVVINIPHSYLPEPTILRTRYTQRFVSFVQPNTSVAP